ncbi:MAG: glycosyltransferase, partial [Planctomycetota bacterium]
MSQPRVLVALATFNERETLPSLVDAVHRSLPHADVLVVDDNSPDGTGEWCDGFGGDHRWFRCVHREGKLGLGSALKRSIELAVAEGYWAVATLDADWSHPPEALPALIAKAEAGADVVIGSRYCPGAEIVGWPWSRLAVSGTLNRLTRLASGLEVADCSGNYRLYRTEAAAKIDWGRVRASGYSFLEEVLAELRR